AGAEWVRPALCEDALRVGRILAELVPAEPEVHGLVALLEIQASRLHARVGPGGEPILLADQDRSRWDQLLIRRGLAALERAEQLAGALGPYALQAAIAACHARARTPAETDWTRITALYDALAQLTQSPVLEVIEQGATHVGVATDHVIESFRNALWSEYKTGDGIEPALLAQFHPLEEALTAMGVAIWPMTDLEADDALASAAQIASRDERVEKVCLWSPDKDLAQCVRGDHVVQVDRKGQKVRNAAGVREKFGVEPTLIPDCLALVGDAADGYPG